MREAVIAAMRMHLLNGVRSLFLQPEWAPNAISARSCG